MSESYLTKATRGLAAINALLGESWVDPINPDRIRMQDPWNCVLGHAFDGYGEYRSLATGFQRGMDALSGTSREIMCTKRHMYALEHGFDSPTDRGYKILDKVWRDLITAQKARRMT